MSSEEPFQTPSRGFAGLAAFCSLDFGNTPVRCRLLTSGCEESVVGNGLRAEIGPKHLLRTDGHWTRSVNRTASPGEVRREELPSYGGFENVCATTGGMDKPLASNASRTCFAQIPAWVMDPHLLCVGRAEVYPAIRQGCSRHYRRQSNRYAFIDAGRVAFGIGSTLIPVRPGMGTEFDLDYDQVARGEVRYRNLPFCQRDDEAGMRMHVDPNWKRILPRW